MSEQEGRLVSTWEMMHKNNDGVLRLRGNNYEA